jgi:putative DNA primase/helicase
MEPVARRLLGEPNAALSDAKNLRWGANGSMVVNIERGLYYNHELKGGGGVIDFVMAQQLMERSEARGWLRQEYPSHFPPKLNGAGSSDHIVQTYDYIDADGTLLFQVCRKHPKAFLQRRPDGKGGWIWSTKGVRAIPYRLVELLADIADARPVWVCEGEKDADRLRAGGLAATTNAGGVGKWRAALTPYFKGADVVIIADNDKAGQDHAAAVAAALAPVVRRVRVLDLGKLWPECPPKGDASDFLAAHSIADLEALAATLSDAPPPAPEPARAEGAPLSDSHLAAAFAAQNDEGRYDQTWRTWDGARWKSGGELRVQGAVRLWLNTDVVPFVTSKKDQLILGGNAKLHSVEHELRLVRNVEPDIWDTQPWLLNTPAGTWQLRGPPQLREHRRDDLLTKVTACDASGECPRWREFIEFVTNGDREFGKYLQRLCGYALIGVRTAQMFAFLYGSGGNGKGVFLQVLTAVMGDYAAWTQADVWLEQRYPRHSEELMALRGARLVVASEFPEGGEWNVARLKQVSGGDKIRASYKHQNSVEFQTSALLILAGNDKPTLKSIDPGIVRRLHLIPFENQIDDEHRIDGLAEELTEAEGRGILAWMLEGVGLWQQLGLAPPSAVTAATSEYLEDEGTLGQWVEDRLERGPSMQTLVGRMFADWRTFSTEAGVSTGSIKGFTQSLVKAGFKRHRSGGKRYFLDVRLKADDDQNERDIPF